MPAPHRAKVYIEKQGSNPLTDKAYKIVRILKPAHGRPASDLDKYCAMLYEYIEVEGVDHLVWSCVDQGYFTELRDAKAYAHNHVA
jgi:hypothetical protein